MSRLTAAIRHEALNQSRQKVYHASAFVTAVLAVLLVILPPAAARIVPAILLTNMVIVTFVFVAGLLLLEKGERTLEGQIVSPLRAEEYLLAKVVSLSALAAAENVVIVGVALATGLIAGVSWIWVLAGTLVSAVLYTLLGFHTAIRYRTLNEFLMPMIGLTTILELPALVPLGMPEWPWLYLLPTHGPLIMFEAAVPPAAGGPVDPRPLWAMVYAVAYPALWIGVAFWRGGPALRRFVTAEIGDA
jgi:fluoroquinolone transport system permease protein